MGRRKQRLLKKAARQTKFSRKSAPAKKQKVQVKPVIIKSNREVIKRIDSYENIKKRA